MNNENFMQDILIKQLMQTKNTLKYSINTGDLRQIGKTTAIVKLAKEFAKESFLQQNGFIPKFNVFVITYSQSQKTGMKKLIDDEGITVYSLNDIEYDNFKGFRFPDNSVVLFDEIPEGQMYILRDFMCSGNALQNGKIVFRAGLTRSDYK